MTLAQDARPPFTMDAVCGEFVTPVVGQHEQGPFGHVASQLADDLQAHLVGPMQVAEDQHRGPVHLLQDPVGRGADDQASRAQGVAVMASVDREEVFGQAPPLLISTDGHCQLSDGGQWHLVVLRRDGAAIHPHSRGFRLARRGPHETRLAQAGPAGQEYGATAPGIRFGDQLVE